uniref:Histone deacetylase 14 n=1 Tax=Tanacetum cinerariifolium TaxID=118510 RepID=A0A6L2KH33_TANCI|nr:histone deacetylase 14 [Tanacetum cinerariifolium]
MMAKLSDSEDMQCASFDHDHYQEAACAFHEEHMMHDCVQLNHVVDSHDEYTHDSNIIMCDQYVRDNEVPVVHSGASSVPTDAFMMIYDDMCEPHDQSVSYPSRNTELSYRLSFDKMADVNAPSDQTPTMAPPVRPLQLPPPFREFTSSSSGIRFNMTRKLEATGVSWTNSGSDKDSPAPKPTKPARKPKSTALKAPPRPSISTPVTSAQPAPISAPAKPQEKKRKQATETSNKPPKAKKSKFGPSVVIKEPESGKYQPLSEVPGKGKAKELYTQSIHTFIEDKQNLCRHTSGKKRATLIVIPSIQFTKLIIHHLQRKHRFHPRPESPLHLSNEELVLGYLKFSAKGTKREIFGMPIPSKLIMANIREAPYYQEYQENVAKHRGFLAGETGSTQDLPAPKPAKLARKPQSTTQKAPLKPSISSPVTSTQPAPTLVPAKTQENKYKQATGTTDKPAKAKRIKRSAFCNTHQPRSSPKSVGASEAGEILAEELQVADEDADFQKAVEEIMKDAYALPKGPLPPVVIREPESGKYQPLPEVPRKGKAKVSEEQVAHDLLSLQKHKKTSPADQYIFQRRVSEHTASSFHDESPYEVLGQSESEEESEKIVLGAGSNPDETFEGQAGSNPDETSKGQAGPNPGNAEARVQSTSSPVVYAGSDREHMDLDVANISPQPSTEQLYKGFTATAYSNVQENLKLAVEEPVLLEEPASSSGTLSSMQQLSRDFSFGDQFFSDKPSDADKSAATEVKSMVNVPIQQALSSISLMTSPIIDLTSRPESPKEHQQLKATTTDTTTTTTTTLPPPQAPQQSTTEAMMAHEDHMQLFKALEKSINCDHSEELAHDLAEARKKRKKGRESPKTPPGSPSHQPPPPPPPAGPSGTSGAPRAFGSQVTPPPPPPPTSTNQDSPSKGLVAPSPAKTAANIEHQAWSTPDVTLKLLVSFTPEDLDMDEAIGPDAQAQLSDEEDIGSAHIPTVNLRQGWWKPFEEERPTTPKPAWSIRSSDVPVPTNNWASTLASNYSPPPKDLLLAQTGDITTFMDWFCKRRGITKLKHQDLEGPAYEIVKVFHPDVIHLQYQMEECHKLLTDSVDDPILRHNVSKPLPLGGPPSQVTIHSDFFFNKDLEYLRYGSKGRRPALSISKMKATYYPDAGLEQMVPDYTVRTYMRILSVVRIEVFSMYGYDYMKKIVLRRADLNEHVIAERDFKYLYPSDFEDLNLLNLQGHLNHLPPKDKKIFTTAVNQWTRQLVIRQRVEDFQLRIESYQTQVNLTKPQWTAMGFEYKHDYTVIESPRAVIFRDKYEVQMMMRFNEIHKFSDGTLQQIVEALDYWVKEFRINRMNPGLNTRFWTRKDVDRCNAFMFAIQRRLRKLRIFRNLESFVRGRVREGDYRLLRDLPEADMKEILHQRMWESDSYKSHEDHMQLFKALEKSINRDHYEELAHDLAEAQKKRKKGHESPKMPPGSPSHQPPPPPPPAGPSGTSGDPRASGSQVTPPPPPPTSTNQDSPSKGSAAPSPAKTTATTEHQAWSTPDVTLKPLVSLTFEDLDMDEAMGPDEQAQLSDEEDIGNAHIPTVSLRQGWWKPFEEERPTTPEPACMDDPILRHNVSKPLPLGGPPSQVIIQSDFFFNKDLEYLRYGSKGRRPALSILKMKAAYYPDAGLEQMMPDLFWIEEEYKYDIAAMYGISHWWFQRQRFYIDRHTSEGDRSTVRTHIRILSVVRIEVFSMYGYDYIKKIVLRYTDLNEHVITERDFKYLYPSDFEDLNLLNLQGHLNHLPPKDKKILTTAINQWTRQLVIRQHVEDF